MIVMTPEQEKELARREATGQFRGDALIEMGLAVRKVVNMAEEAATKKAEKKARAVDPDKQALMDALLETLEGRDEVLVLDVTGREIRFKTHEGVYTMALTKHKAKQYDYLDIGCYSSINIDFSSNNGSLCADAKNFSVASVD